MAVVAAAAAIGLALLWNLDLLVYHRLLAAYFRTGMQLEKQYPWLPQTRHNMMRGTWKERGVRSQVVWFYAVSISMMWLASGVAAAVAVRANGTWAVLLCIVASLAFAAISSCAIVRITGCESVPDHGPSTPELADEG